MSAENTDNICIRDAVPADAAAILDIYTPYITDTAITFEEHVPSLAEFTTRIQNIIHSYPYLVAVLQGRIIGYAYASPLKTRDAFARSCELSIYLQKEHERHGLGTRLYKELFNRLKLQGIISVYAAIAACRIETPWLTPTSIRFHEALGFKQTGIFPECAAKFNTWFDLVWMYKDLTERSQTQADSTLFIPRHQTTSTNSTKMTSDSQN